MLPTASATRPRPEERWVELAFPSAISQYHACSGAAVRTVTGPAESSIAACARSITASTRSCASETEKPAFRAGQTTARRRETTSAGPAAVAEEISVASISPAVANGAPVFGLAK